MPKSTKGRVYVTRVIPSGGIDSLAEHVDLAINDADQHLSHENLKQHAGEVDGLVTLLTDVVDLDVLSAGAALKVVANVAVGYDNIDVEAATRLGIAVTNTPGVLTETTADFAWALMMGIARRVAEGDVYMRGGQYTGWGINLMLGHDVYGSVLGLVGMGRIGQAMAKRARGFDMTVIYCDEYRLPEERERELGVEYVPMATLFKDSDFISVHTPLTTETHHLVSWDTLTAMKPNACLVNTSRGPVVNEEHLARALREGKLAGAALDVFEREPEVHSGLRELSNVIMTPHIASASVATRTRMATMAARNCLAVMVGEEPPNIVNPEVLTGEAFQNRMNNWVSNSND